MNKVIIVAFVISPILLNAQTFDEWFRQEETQIKYLAEQIAALKAYDAEVNKGYGISQKGLTTIFGSKDGDLKQHNEYFLSLWKVKPGIKYYSKVLSILKMKDDIQKERQLIKSLEESLDGKLRNYINTVYSNLEDECNALTAELDMVVNDDQLQLKDNERIGRIDKIYLEMQDHLEFSRAFSGQARLLVINLLKEGNEVRALSALYGLK